jgi:hypothetical protein
MSWQNTYSFTLAITLDVVTASVFWNRRDVTVSSLCGMAIRAGKTSSLLGRIGKVLNWLQTDHCEQAIAYDMSVANSTLQFLTTRQAP